KLGLADLSLLLLQKADERCPEILQERLPALFAAGNLVKLLLKPCGEVVVDISGEMGGKKISDHHTDILGKEPLLVEAAVLPLYKGVHDTGIGRRTADPVLFEGLYQGRFGVAWRRLGEVLFRKDFPQ